MQISADINLDAAEAQELPFRHFSCTEVLSNGLENDLHKWFEQTDAWGLTDMDFYTQFEFSLFDVDLPSNLQTLIAPETVNVVRSKFVELFGLQQLDLAGVTAHKLIDGHKIGVHNDFIGKEETHRMVLQINPGWNEEYGGYLMIFSSPDPEDVVKLVQPLNNTAFGFEISNDSYHAVSTVRNYSRYTLVYTFKQ